MSGFVRSISFTIPGASGSPGVKLYIEEQNGALFFDVEVLDTTTATADLRGLFFRLIDASDSKLAGLKVSWSDGTVTDFQAKDDTVIDLGNGANMNGAVTKTNAFDVGVEFGTQGIGTDDVQDASFTLSNTANNLSLDDISQTLFGARLTSVGSPDGSRDGSVKLLATAPAAPDARDDSYTIFEDNATGLGDPRSATSAVVFQVLSNDTDADGNTLTITALSTTLTAKGGIVEIVDGNDADLLVGDAIRYTPLTDFSGADSFQYLISDGAGGTDFATVSITVDAVADVPTLSYSLAATDVVNQVRLTVTATQTDDDASEFIDKLAFAGNPGNVTVVATDLDPAIQDGTLTREFLVTLPNASSAFTLDVTATAKEISNGDTQTASTGVNFYSIFEDGATGLTSPRDTAQGVTLQLPVSGPGGPIASIGPVTHGTAILVDGNDADTDANDAVLYTPTTDYAGWDSFTYTTASGEQGQASITLNAVADVPDVTYEIIAGSAVNTFTIRVTATQTDNDSSEFIDSLGWSVAGGLPGGVTITPASVNPGTEPDQIIQDFLVTLPIDQDTNFDLVFTATAKEVSNGDTEIGSATVEIDYDYKSNDADTTFLATDQSIWDTGPQTTLEDNRFLGVDTQFGPYSDDGFFSYNFQAGIKAGFQSSLKFEGGEIDAKLPYDILVETNYNKTTDVLLISADAARNGGSFTTEGPEGSYSLDFIFNYLLTLQAGLSIGDPFPDINIVNINTNSNNTLPILDLNSDDLNVTVPLPLGFSVSFAWPNLDTTSLSNLTSSGQSNNALQLNLDVDDLIFALLGVPNPFSFDYSLPGDILYARGDLLDLDLNAGVNFLQNFALAVNGLSASLVFEDGSSQAFVFGQDVTVTNASEIDANGDMDGVVDYTLRLDPDADLSNKTTLGFNVGYKFTVVKIEAGYDISIDLGEIDLGLLGTIDLGEIDLGSDSITIGPLFEASGTQPIATVPLLDTTFDLDFVSKDLAFFA